MSTPEKENKEVRGFLENKNILITDASASCRSSVSRAIIDLGAKTANISPVPSFEQSLELIEKKKSDIIVADYSLGEHSGLDLAEKQKELYLDHASRLFILTTGSSAESTLAEAAEEEIDAFILKPYTGDILKENFLNTILKKLSPTQYETTLQEGKALFQKKEYDQALTFFEEATKLPDATSLAYYYIAKTMEVNEKFEEANGAYEKGLKLSQDHYRCLTGKFDLHQKLDQIDAAYKTLQVIVEKFPISPKTLGKLFELAVKTRNFTDIDRFYDLFTGLERRPDSLVKIVSAGLSVSGMYLLRQGKEFEAEDSFKKAISTSKRDKKIILLAIEKLVDAKEYILAETFLKLFQVQDQTTSEYYEADLLVQENIGDKQKTALRARELIKKGLKSPSIYKIAIRQHVELQLLDTAEDLADQATLEYPELEDTFNSYFPDDVFEDDDEP